MVNSGLEVSRVHYNMNLMILSKMFQNTIEMNTLILKIFLILFE